MSQPQASLRPGDLVEVREPDEILQTLDAEGAVDHLPFMPEMLQFCGQRARVANKVVTTCFSGAGSQRAFKTNDVVTLDSMRCTGAAHDGCQKACLIFWREAWLRKVDDSAAKSKADPKASERLRARLITKQAPKIYFCQSTELAKATYPLASRWQKFSIYFTGLHAGNFGPVRLATMIWTWVYWRARRIVLGVHARGNNKTTPVLSLNLQPGEWVEVKSVEDISETLNEHGKNRGLYFSPDMRRLCGQRRRVKTRLDRIIADGSGEMRQLNNTVSLENSTCACAYMTFGFGGCSRSELTYWREGWLRRVEPQNEAERPSAAAKLPTTVE